MKTELNHTPVKWRVEAGREQFYIVDEHGNYVAKVIGDSLEDEANAQLIASAPDLLAENKRLREALDNLIGCLRMVDGKPHICAASIQVASALEKARAALANK